MFPAKNIMTTDVMSVKAETLVCDAMRILIDNQISGLPVVDNEENVIGIISEKDMLRLLFNTSIKENDTVLDYMTKEVVSFKEEDSAVDICEFFMNSSVRRVPIVREGKLVGIVSRRNLIKTILHLWGKD
ncbi:MAG: CBS domain-containing protein [Candidatus Omnitrophica bacterium]|nr:CBS domain-containing protein [Candidatus Omnitrophota bacterium]